MSAAHASRAGFNAPDRRPPPGTLMPRGRQGTDLAAPHPSRSDIPVAAASDQKVPPGSIPQLHEARRRPKRRTVLPARLCGGWAGADVRLWYGRERARRVWRLDLHARRKQGNDNVLLQVDQTSDLVGHRGFGYERLGLGQGLCRSSLSIRPAIKAFVSCDTFLQRRLSGRKSSSSVLVTSLQVISVPDHVQSIGELLPFANRSFDFG